MANMKQQKSSTKKGGNNSVSQRFLLFSNPKLDFLNQDNVQFCGRIINTLLTELSRSVCGNLDLSYMTCTCTDLKCCVQSVLTTLVKILPYRPPACRVANNSRTLDNGRPKFANV